MRNLRLRFLHTVLSFALGLTFAAHAEVLRVGGTGSAEPLINRLFEEFDKLYPGLSGEVVTPPLGSAGGAKALATGRIDLAIISRPMKAEEKAALGHHFEWCATPFVLATHGRQQQNSFTLDELASIYDGRVKTWQNTQPIRLVLRTRDDSDTAQLRSLSPAMAKAVDAADRRPGMAFANDDMDTLEILKRTPGSLGPSSLGLLRTTGSQLDVLPLNGKVPSLAALQDGSYPWRKTLTVVLPLKPSVAATRFAEFLLSRTAAEIMRRYDYLPARP